MDIIKAEADERVSAVREGFDRAVRAINEDIAKLEREIERRTGQIAEAKAELEAARSATTSPVTAAELQPRSAQEEHMSEAEIRGARYTERRDNFQAITIFINKLDMELSNYRGHRDLRLAGRDTCRKDARAQVDAIYARCHKCIHEYWQGVVEKHRDGDALSVMLTENQLPKAPDVEGW